MDLDLAYQGSTFSDYDGEANSGDTTDETIQVPGSVLERLSEASGEAPTKLSTASLDPFAGFSVSLVGPKREQLTFCPSEPV